ncbi:hemerythrin domain-containing protein [Alteromonas sediminis]|uniref:Hemerythrin domain-containing protein n=1 Tax=Alteromonas sediminis TaxID=2259342 RepID=A0A3N5Y800_9ALTE|nr:hemerythrin domain-containing protein [Alteromonas sediminis]RPJ67009.1 hemerythrin domain-containing protein [Alteromonas sediminis]
MKIFEAIRKDHEKQRLLMKILVETSGDTPSRREYFAELKQQLKDHAEAEEKFFYRPLIKEDRTIEQSRHGMHEHHQIDELVEQLDETEMSSPAWLHHMKKLQDKVLHHLAEEEREVFQQAGIVLTEDEKTKLAKSYEAEMA